jgi:hypothetical protein
LRALGMDPTIRTSASDFNSLICHHSPALPALSGTRRGTGACRRVSILRFFVGCSAGSVAALRRRSVQTRDLRRDRAVRLVHETKSSPGALGGRSSHPIRRSTS